MHITFCTILFLEWTNILHFRWCSFHCSRSRYVPRLVYLSSQSSLKSCNWIYVLLKYITLFFRRLKVGSTQKTKLCLNSWLCVTHGFLCIKRKSVFEIRVCIWVNIVQKNLCHNPGETMLRKPDIFKSSFVWPSLVAKGFVSFLMLIFL